MLWDQYFSGSIRRLTVVSDNQLYWLPIKVHFAIAVLLNVNKLVILAWSFAFLYLDMANLIFKRVYLFIFLFVRFFPGWASTECRAKISAMELRGQRSLTNAKKWTTW